MRLFRYGLAATLVLTPFAATAQQGGNTTTITGKLPAFATTPTVSIGNFPATQPVSIASPIAVTGSFFPSIQPVSGTVTVGNFPSIQPVSGTVSTTITGGLNGNGQALMAASSPVVIASNQSSIPVLATLASGSSISVSNFPATQPVSGTVTANQGGAPWSTTVSGTLPAYASTPTFNLGTGLPASYPDAVADAVLGTTTDAAYTSGTGAATIAGLLRGINNKIDAANQSPLVAQTGTGYTQIGDVRLGLGSSLVSSSNPLPVTVTSGGGTGGSTVTDASGSTTQSVSTSATSTSGVITLASRAELVAHVTGLAATGSTVTPTLALADGTYVAVLATPLGGGANQVTITADGWYRFKVSGAGAFQFSGTAGTTAGTVTYAYTATTNPGNIAATITNSVANPVNVNLASGLNANGQKPMAGSSPVAIASDQSAIPVSTTNGSTAAGQATNHTDLGTIATNQNATAPGTSATAAQAVQGVTGGVAMPTMITGGLNGNGQATMANSSPVTIASNQSSIPVLATLASGSTVGIVAGTASIGTVGLNAGTASIGTVGLNAGTAAIGTVGVTSLPALVAGTANIGSIANITGTVSLPTGASTAAAQTNVQSAPGTSAGTAITVQGSATGVNLPVNIASGLNGNGQKTMANSSPVTMASDQNLQQTLQFTEFNATATTANGTSSGTVRTPGTNYPKFRTVFVSTQTGTANVQGCLDAACATAFTVATSSVAANSPTSVPVDVVFPYYRAQFVNGATAGTITIVDALNAS